MDILVSHGSMLVLMAAAVGFFMAWGIGANDVANAMGTSVGSKALTIKQAIIIAMVFEFAGAYLAGGEVTSTIRKGIIDASYFVDIPELMVFGMISALFAAATWLLIASALGWPVSTTHSIIGAIVGFTGSIAAKNVGIPLSGLRLFAGVFLVFLGLYLGQWLMWIARVEKLGQKLWRYLSPISKRFIPVDNTKKALSLGALWGWLPCGLIYSTLTWALASNSALQGAGIMFSFGLGTLPALVTISLGLLHVKKLLTNPIFRKSMALLVLLYGIYTIIFASKHLF